MPNRYEIGPKSDPDQKWLTVVLDANGRRLYVLRDLDFVHVIATS
jgi:hypothetical protein